VKSELKSSNNSILQQLTRQLWTVLHQYTGCFSRRPRASISSYRNEMLV